MNKKESRFQTKSSPTLSSNWAVFYAGTENTDSGQFPCTGFPFGTVFTTDQKKSSVLGATMKESVSPHFQIARRELKAWYVAKYFWWTYRCLKMWSNYCLDCFVYMHSQSKLERAPSVAVKVYATVIKVRSWFLLFKLAELIYNELHQQGVFISRLFIPILFYFTAWMVQICVLK